MPSEDHLQSGHGEAVLFCPEVGKRVLGDASLASSKVVDALAHGAATEFLDDRTGDSGIDECRGLDFTLEESFSP